MLIYLLKSTVCLLAFSLFYKLFLEKENIHVFKRFYLLGSLALSFYIPLITFTTYIEQPVIDFQVSNSFTPNTMEVIPVEEPTNWIPILLWFLYGLGTLFFAVKFLLNLYRLIEKIRSNEKVQHKDYVHVLLLKHIVPHTFMKYIFLDKQAFDNYNIPQEILLHEQAHAQQKHSLDILFAEFLQILFWFNPLIYSIKKDIKLNHEFLADHEVIKQGYNAKNYQTILLSYSSKPSGYPLESSFNYSSIKKRFTLMKTHTSKTALWLRSFFVLPLLAMLVYGFSEKKEMVKSEPTNNNHVFSKNENPDNSSDNHRIISIAGLVLDAHSLEPLEGVEIYDTSRNLMAKTDDNGYYNISINTSSNGEILFDLSLQKQGYKPFLQKEHWGNLSGQTNSNLYFGLQKQGSKAQQFSKLVANANNLSYQNILTNYTVVKKEILFDKQVEEKRQGNQKVFFEIDNIFYLINDSGWIQLNSKEDLVSIDDKKIIKAKELNSLLRRSDVIGMTPLQNNRALFAIYTDKETLEHNQSNSWGKVETILNKSSQNPTIEPVAIYIDSEENLKLNDNPVLRSNLLTEVNKLNTFLTPEQKRKYVWASIVYEDNKSKPLAEQLAKELITANISTSAGSAITNGKLERNKFNSVSNQGKTIEEAEARYQKMMSQESIQATNSYIDSLNKSESPWKVKVGVTNVTFVDDVTGKETIIQQGASKEQLEEYNKLAKHLNLIIKKQGVVKVKDVVRMKELYELMSEEQRENTEKFPDLSKLPPPPPPANIQQVIPTLTIDQDNKNLKLNGKSTSLETLKQDFLTITSNQKADLKIESKGSISTILITDLSERLKPYLGKVLFSGTSIIEDREFETSSNKSDQTVNEFTVPLLVLNNGTTIPCDKCTVGLTKELIKPLELSTNTKEEITSFQIKFPGKPTKLVKGNQLNALALKNLESSQENDHIIIFNIKTSKQTLDSNITIKIIKSVPPPPPPPAPKAEKPVVPTKEG